MLKGRYTALIFSVVIHFALILLLINQEMTIPNEPSKTDNAIKSYIYTPPQKTIPPKEQPVTEPKPEIEAKIIEKQEQAKPPTADSSQAILIEKRAPETIQKQEPTEQIAQDVALENKETIEDVDNKTIKDNLIENKPIQRKFSALKQLGNLKNKVNQDIFAQEYATQNRAKSPSVMHAAPNTVPHSTQHLTKEQKDKNNTANYSGSISTTKYDNGNCMVEQDLSSVGIEGVKSQQWFECGESKFDKSFREHMKRVQRKLAR